MISSPRPKFSASSLIPGHTSPTGESGFDGVFRDQSTADKPTRPLQRSKSALATQHSKRRDEEDDEENWELRHGWDAQFSSEDYLQLLASVRIQFKATDAFGKSNVQ